MSDILPNLTMLVPGLLDPQPWAEAYRAGHMLQSKDGEIRMSRRMCIALYIYSFRPQGQALRVFVSTNKAFFSKIGGYVTVRTKGSFVPSDYNRLDPIKFLTYYGDHPGFPRSFRYSGPLRQALSERTTRENFKVQRTAVQNAEGLWCFHPQCCTPNCAIQTDTPMPFSLCTKCFSAVEQAQIYPGVSYCRLTGLPEPLKNLALIPWLDRPVLCALMCIKYVCKRASIPYPKGLSPKALRPLGIHMQNYPHGFCIPKTPEMLLLLNFSTVEMCNVMNLKYYPPKITNTANKLLFREADEKGAVALDGQISASPTLVQKSWAPRMYPFRPAYIMHKMHDGRYYLVSPPYAKLASIANSPLTPELRYTIHVIVEEPVNAEASVSSTTTWEHHERLQTAVAKCTTDGCEFLRTGEYPLCPKCSPECCAPFCSNPSISAVDNMCGDHGGHLRVSITIKDAHTCTFQQLSDFIDERVHSAKKVKQKRIADRRKGVLKQSKKKVGQREAEHLADLYAKDLENQPLHINIDIRGCAITTASPVQPMWGGFFSRVPSEDGGVFIQPHVGSQANNNAFLFFVGCATSPLKHTSISYSNYYDPMCCTKVAKVDVEAYNSLTLPNVVHVAASQHLTVGANAHKMFSALGRVAATEAQEECTVLWSDDEDAGGPSMKRSKLAEE